jgi:hypothetical protein
MTVSLENTLRITDGPTLLVTYSVQPEDKDIGTLRRAQEAISKIDIFTELVPALPPAGGSLNIPVTLIPQEAFARKGLMENQYESNILFTQKVQRVSYIRAIFRVGTRKADFIFSQTPVRLLVAAQRL